MNIDQKSLPKSLKILLLVAKAPKRPKTSPRRPQDAPKTAPRRPQDVPKLAQDTQNATRCPARARCAPILPPDVPKTPQKSPQIDFWKIFDSFWIDFWSIAKMWLRRAEMPPFALQTFPECLRWPPAVPKTPQDVPTDGPKSLQIAPKASHAVPQIASDQVLEAFSKHLEASWT